MKTGSMKRLTKPRITSPGRRVLQKAALMGLCLSMGAFQMAVPGAATAAPIGLGLTTPSSPMAQGIAPKYFSVANWANSKLPVITTPTTVTTIGATGTGAVATPVVINGKVLGVAINAPGTGYLVGDAVTIAGSGTGATASVTTVGAGGSIAAITVTAPGSGYDLVTTPGIRKFIDTLPGLNPVNTDTLGNYIPVAVPDTTTYLGSDYYEIAVVEYRHRFHTDLHPSLATGAKIRSYVQLVSSGGVLLTDANGAPILLPNGTQARGVTQPSYLGPIISATKDRPVRILFRNLLPKGDAGHLFLPTDVTVMGAGMGPSLDPAMETNMQVTMCEGTAPTYTKPAGCYAENRATLHLHGGHTPWVSDGTPHQWTVPAGETSTAAALKKGASTQNVPDMPNPGDGAMTFFYTNQQSARLMFYHDHAWGITRLNVYAGEAAGYLITDATEQKLITGGVIPGPADTIPLILQDKTFVAPLQTQLKFTDPLWDDTRWGGEGQLWYPHVYIPAQNPGDASGTNPFGRWNYGLYFHPALTVGTDVQVGTIPNPYYDAACNTSLTWCEPPTMPGTPYTSMTMEAFHDTPVINGTAYPKVTLDPKPYRLRLLNASNDRFFNLSLYQAVDANGAPCPDTGSTAVTPSGESCTEVALDPTMLVAAVADPTIFPTPVPGLEGPNWIQIGTESGFLPQPAVIPAHPITWVTDLTLFSAGNVDKHSLLIAPAERADVIVDLSAYAGKTLILYNDAPAAFPARDPRVDYYTGNSDQRAVGGAPSTIAGFGPNTRTMMKITVNAGTGTPFNMTNLTNAFAHQPDTTGTTNGFGVFEESQHPIIVGQGEYNSTYGTVFPTGGTLNGTVQIQDGGITFNALANPKTNATKGSYQNGPQLTMALEGKAIHDEMNAAWDVIYGRMSGNLGLEPARPPAGLGQQLVLYPFINPPTEIFNGIQLPPGVEVTPIASATDGTQIWKIAHNGVDTHPIHFHMADVQLLNRVDWQNLMLKPDANELGWKETIRISPLEDTIVAIRPLVPKLPFGLPDSIRPLNPAMAIGSAALFNSTDAAGNALATPITNQMTNFNWEFVWHCHILSHEEMDMMRPISNIVTGTLPAPPATTYSRNGNVVTLNWVDGTPIPTTNPVSLGLWGNPANEVGFRVQRALVAANGTVGPFSTIFTAPANTTTYTDSTVLTGQSYRYRVIAFNSAGQTNSSIVGGAAPSGLPLSPTGAVATLSAGSSINLTWQDNATNESYFLVQRRVDGGAWTFLAQVPPLNATGTVTYNDKPVAYPHSYQYRVYAVNALGSSTAFALSNIKSPIAPPAAPTALSVAVVNQGGSDQATLTWTDNATNEASFVIQRATDAAFTVGVNYSTVPAKTATPPSTVTAVQTGLLAPGVTYYFRVQATNTSGQSAWSNVFSVVTL